MKDRMSRFVVTVGSLSLVGLLVSWLCAGTTGDAQSTNKGKEWKEVAGHEDVRLVIRYEDINPDVLEYGVSFPAVPVENGDQAVECRVAVEFLSFTHIYYPIINDVGYATRGTGFVMRCNPGRIEDTNGRQGRPGWARIQLYARGHGQQRPYRLVEAYLVDLRIPTRPGEAALQPGGTRDRENK